ncbi:alpha/beta hydrolase [Microbacterium sp.]|uniref:alpha/beta fold hydrolase n=1 Tax=Microbacterium sp. TaxID=51671 RepID=UPI002812439A|nr:alpha/beta hydrolase [Microbacterium sp.]
MRQPRRTVTRHRVAGLTLRSLTSPGPGAVTFVLVHGIGMSHRYLARLHSALSAHGTVVSVDLPGFGGLPKPAHDLDVTQMADALAGLLDKLRTGPVVVVGQSMGTQWAVELAARRRDLTRGVVVIGPVADERRRTLLWQAALLALDTLREPPGANALVFSDYLRCGPVWYLAQLRHMLRYRIEDRVSRLQAPLLIVRGSRDPIATRGWCRRLRAAAREAMLAEIPGRAHNAQHSAPRAVAAAIVHACASMPTSDAHRHEPSRGNGR